MKKAVIITLTVFIIFTVYSLWADKAICERTFEIKKSDIGSSFDGFTIAHVSDLHNTSFGENNKKLLDRLKKMNPDLIAVTGDIVDSRRTDTDVAASFMKKALEIAPVYYVTGNHESRIDNSEGFLEDIRRLGVKLLENESVSIKRNNEEINLSGISDPAFVSDYLFDDEASAVSRSLENLVKKSKFNILLAHRPEFFSLYAKEGFDLVLSGHAHGGQFRLPIIGGFIAPGQGIFPEYDSGLYEKNGTQMIVSRGLGNSIIPLRIFNRPEIITIVLRAE